MEKEVEAFKKLFYVWFNRCCKNVSEEELKNIWWKASRLSFQPSYKTVEKTISPWTETTSPAKINLIGLPVNLKDYKKVLNGTD